MILALLIRNRQLHLHGHRIHHGLAGLILTGIGLALMLDDWPDRWWNWR